MSTFCILLALLFSLLVLLYRNNLKKLHLPPGPFCFPIVGYLLQINPKAPHVTLTNLSRKYGPICGLKMGSVYTVLLSDPRLIRQVLAKDVFSGRAPLYLTHGIMKGYGLICAEGDLWREQRRFVTNCLKNLGMLKFGPKREKLEERILVAANECIMKIKERSTKDDGFEPLDILHHCLGNLINSLVFGKTYEEDDQIWKWLRHLQEEGVKHIGVAGPLNFLPFLRFIPRYGNTMATLIDGKIKTHKVYRTIIEEHREKMKRTNNASPNAIPTTESFLAAFDQEMTNRREADNVGHFTESQFYHLLADLFGAGVDTTLTTLRWLLLFMAVYPEEQGKVYEEMVQVLGRENKPCLVDRDALIRLEATISEVQRIRSVTPIGIPHGTTENTKIGEYDVPKNTMVVPLQWAIHMDPNYWDNPLEFKTDRFIADDGSLLKPEAFLPFQSGKRMCIGDELARMILFLFAGRILHAFKISLPPDETLDLEGECGITLIPKPHRLLFEHRERIIL